jgi:glutaryl-CoA dehydrogenase
MGGEITLEQLAGWSGSLSEEEHMVRASVRRFVSEKWMPVIESCFEKGEFPLDLIPELADLGVLGATIQGYGCPGMGHTAYGLAMYELEYGDSGLRSFASVQGSLVMYAINRFGSEEQKLRWLPALAKAEVIGCFGLTEPDSGSDPGGMKMRAKKEGSDWILNGEKLWITNSPIADVAVVWAKTGEGSESIQGFLVERGTPGFSAPEIPRKMSMRCSSTGGLVLQDVRIPDSCRLAGSGGLRSPLSCLNNARFSVAFGVMGAARACVQAAMDYTQERIQFGVPIASKQLIQGQLVDMASQVITGELLALHTARLKDAGNISPYQISLAKRNNCDAALKVARQCRGLMGANGVTLDYHVIRHALNLESTYTYEGTHEIHALIIGKGLTGLHAF